MNVREIQNRSEQLVGKIEKGDRTSLTDELNNMSFEERLAVAREMDRLNAEHRKTDCTLPDIQISFAGTSGNEQLIDMNIKDGERLTDIYDRKAPSAHNKYPGSIQFGTTHDGKQAWRYRDGNLIIEGADGAQVSKSGTTQEHMAKARELLVEIYSGNTAAAARDLNGLSGEARLAVAREMDKQNADDRRRDGKLPDIQVSSAGYAGRDQLVNLNIKNGGKRTDIYRYRAR